MLTPINPLDLWKVWHNAIKPGVEKILATNNKECVQELWTPEDVWTSIKTGESVLWLGEEGFVVTQIQQDRYTGIKKLYVWLGYSFENDGDVLSNSYEQLVNYGRYMECALITFSSVRRGWIKRAKTIGMAQGPVTYAARI
jgi:hypothetical protein